MSDINARQIIELLKWAYDRIPEARKGKTVCINFDPAGSDYEFIEYEESKLIREILNYTYEPTGL